MACRRWQSLELLYFVILLVLCAAQDGQGQFENSDYIFEEENGAQTEEAGYGDDTDTCKGVLIIGTDVRESTVEIIRNLSLGLLEDDHSFAIKLPGRPLDCIHHIDDVQSYISLEPDYGLDIHSGLDHYLTGAHNEGGRVVAIAEEHAPPTHDIDVLLRHMIQVGPISTDVIIINPNKEGDVRYRRQSGSNPYQIIATMSGGSVLHTTKNGISQVVDLLKQTLKQSTVEIMRFTWQAAPLKQFTVPVDDTITELTVQVQSNSTAPVVIVNYPGGGPVSFKSGSGNSIKNLGGSVALVELQIQAGDYGDLIIKSFDSNLWDVKVTAQSPVDFTYNFMEPGPNGLGQYPIQGRPMAGASHTLIVKVPEYGQINTVAKVLFLDDRNNVLNSHALTNKGGRHGKDLWEAQNVPIPADTFKIAIEGTDQTGHTVRRLAPIPVSPVSVRLVVPSMAGVKLYKGETLEIPFTVTNEGASKQDIDVSIEDDRKFAQAPNLLSYTLSSKQNDSNKFTIKAGMVVGQTVTVTLTAKPFIRGTITNPQFEVRRFTVEERKKKPEDKISPTCNVTSVTGKCDFGSDLCSCADHRWSMDVNVGDVGFGLQDVFPVSAGSNSTFNVDNFTIGHNISMGIITATIEADCCHQSATIQVLDKAGNTGQCSPNITQNFQAPDPKLCNKTAPLNVTIPCLKTEKTGTCNFGPNKCDCHTMGWHLKVEFGSVGFDLFSAYTDGAGNNASITQTNQFVELDSDCCHQQITVYGLDLANNVGECNVSLSNFTTPDPGDCSSTTSTTTTTTTPSTTTVTSTTTASSGSTTSGTGSTTASSTAANPSASGTTKKASGTSGTGKKSTSTPQGSATKKSGSGGSNAKATTKASSGASGASIGASGSGSVTAASVSVDATSDEGSSGVPVGAVAAGMTIGALAGVAAVLAMAFLFRRALTKVSKAYETDSFQGVSRRGSSPLAWS